MYHYKWPNNQFKQLFLYLMKKFDISDCTFLTVDQFLFDICNIAKGFQYHLDLTFKSTNHKNDLINNLSNICFMLKYFKDNVGCSTWKNKTIDIDQFSIELKYERLNNVFYSFVGSTVTQISCICNETFDNIRDLNKVFEQTVDCLENNTHPMHEYFLLVKECIDYFNVIVEKYFDKKFDPKDAEPMMNSLTAHVLDGFFAT